jgi:hypothetical protein
MRKRIFPMVALGILVCMPLAAQRNRNAGGAAAPMNVPRAMSTMSTQTGSTGTSTRTHTVTNPAGSVTTTVTKSPTGSTRTMVNTEGNKTLTLTHHRLARSRGSVTRTLTRVRKTAKSKTAHRNLKVRTHVRTQSRM